MHGESEKEGKPWGRGEQANMPQEVKKDTYPKAPEYGASVENDTMTRIDAENKRAKSTSRSHMSNQH